MRTPDEIAENIMDHETVVNDRRQHAESHDDENYEFSAA